MLRGHDHFQLSFFVTNAAPPPFQYCHGCMKRLSTYVRKKLLDEYLLQSYLLFSLYYLTSFLSDVIEILKCFVSKSNDELRSTIKIF